MSEKSFTTYQIANLLGATPGAVVDWVNKDWIKSTQMPDGQMRISESALRDFLIPRQIDLSQLLDKVGTPDTKDPPKTADPKPAPQAQYSNADTVAQQIVEAVIEKAIDTCASQIHFTLSDQKLLLKLRIDGIMHDRLGFTQKLPSYLASLIPLYLAKRATDMPANLEKPASGSFDFNTHNNKLTIELHAMPHRGGYTAVLDIKYPPKQLKLLVESQADVQWLEETLDSKTGLILICTEHAGQRHELTQAVFSRTTGDGKFCVSIGPHDCDYTPDPTCDMSWAEIAQRLGCINPDVIASADLRDPKSTYRLIESAHNHTLVIAAMKSPSATAAVNELLKIGVEPWGLKKTLLCVLHQPEGQGWEIANADDIL